ncbi:phosphotransferase family protein [Nocardioides humi]|uniref:phosphotransferase family protein n=1 Tax=Nocardioides humi TaxID=449461 RepID=UPI001C63F3E0|nr:phosphotransferase family protein [Nocardioides humi]
MKASTTTSVDLTAAELAAVSRRLVSTGIDLAGPLRADRIAGGRSNLTFLLTDGTTRWVLRTPPRAGRTPSAHDVGREFRVCRALEDTAVPVPRQVMSVEDDADLGGPYVVAEHVAGASVQSREELDRLGPDRLGRTVEALVSALAALHAVDHAAVGLSGFGRPDGYAARQLRRWSGQWDLVAPADPGARAAAAELEDRLSGALPEQHAAAVVHGDYRIDNTILQIEPGDVQVAAVLDWELSTIGDPVADVAMMCAYRDPAFDLIVGSRAPGPARSCPAPTESPLPTRPPTARPCGTGRSTAHSAITRWP